MCNKWASEYDSLLKRVYSKRAVESVGKMVDSDTGMINLILLLLPVGWILFIQLATTCFEIVMLALFNLSLTP